MITPFRRNVLRHYTAYTWRVNTASQRWLAGNQGTSTHWAVQWALITCLQLCHCISYLDSFYDTTRGEVCCSDGELECRGSSASAQEALDCESDSAAHLVGDEAELRGLSISLLAEFGLA